MHVIKDTRPMERLSIDFKGPIGNLNRYNYMLTVIDEYSRFPFAFPCSNINAETVIKCLTQLFFYLGCVHVLIRIEDQLLYQKSLLNFYETKDICV